MDPVRFDAITRTLSHRQVRSPSRRGLLRAIGTGFLAIGLAPSAETDAKGKRHQPKRQGRKRRRPCLTGQKRCKGRCAGCCSDADCGGNPCKVGVCADCPQGQRLCRGGCIREDACCSDGECTGGRKCVYGVCACAADERLCEGTCIPVDACCGDDCPVESCSPENCTGCCAGTTCRDGDGLNFCGRNGVECLQCGPNELCNGETCLCPTACCADAQCTAAAGGTCHANGTCQYPCAPTSGPCVAGVTTCCDPVARCLDDTCRICIDDGESCNPSGGPPCCNPNAVCDDVAGCVT